MDGVSLEDLPHDVLRSILVHSGPQSLLRGCSRTLTRLAQDESMWEGFCRSQGIATKAESGERWMEVCQRALGCSHQRGARSFSFTSIGTSDYANRFGTAAQPPMATSCVCRKCLRTYDVQILPHHDPHAGGLPMAQLHFTSKAGSHWTETWYLIAKNLYSLRGGEGCPLVDAVTHVQFEMSINSLLGDP